MKNTSNMTNIELGSQKIGEVIGYGASAGVKAVGMGVVSLFRGLKKGASNGIASSPNLPLGPVQKAGERIGSFVGDVRQGWREKNEEVYEERIEEAMSERVNQRIEEAMDARKNGTS